MEEKPKSNILGSAVKGAIIGGIAVAGAITLADKDKRKQIQKTFNDSKDKVEGIVEDVKDKVEDVKEMVMDKKEEVEDKAEDIQKMVKNIKKDIKDAI